MQLTLQLFVLCHCVFALLGQCQVADILGQNPVLQNVSLNLCFLRACILYVVYHSLRLSH